MMVERLFLAVPRGGLRFVIVVFPDHTNLLFLPACLLKVRSNLARTPVYLIPGHQLNPK